ncbi:MAG TPA: SRPBCC family protein [Actinomycetota bacterium]|nr:SRPBCC family protein [Actinomycetota bacterium]
MELENTLEIPAPLDRVWGFMLDVEQVAPCMPGAELTEVVDDHTWKGKVNVKLGPVSLSFAGTVVLQDRDEAAHTVVLKADGRETKGKGTASAQVTSKMEAADGDRTRVSISADLNISGSLAQFGRGMIGDVSQRMANQFAACLGERMQAMEAQAPPAEPVGAAATGEAAPAPPPAGAPLPGAAQPVGGIRLALWALFRALVRGVVRLGKAITGLFKGRSS